METKKMDIYREYCRTRNKVKNMMKFFRKNKERDISFNAKTNNKAFWKYVNAKTKSTSGIASLHANHLDVTGVALPARPRRVKPNLGELKLYVISPGWRVEISVFNSLLNNSVCLCTAQHAHTVFSYVYGTTRIRCLTHK